MAINSCTPQNIFGPFQHTLFLGLSVRDFSCQAGWNDQFNTLTVTLVDDPCEGDREYFDEDFNWVSESLSADPGFNYAPLGSPALFKIGEVKDYTDPDNPVIIFDGFEFGGIIQSYNVQTSADGLDIVTVNMISPGTLLQGTNFIVGEYAHPINVPGNTNYPQNLQNLINVYGYLETLGYDCLDFNSPNDPFGPGLGAPGAKFGGAQKTSAGTPWTLIKNAIQVLCGGQYNGDLRNDGNFNFNSIPGTLKYIAGAGTYGSIPSDQYILDISELPGEIAGYGGDNDPDAGGGGTDPTLNQSNNQYRIQGPVISALDLISQIAEDAGMDYIISLMPTKAVGYPSSTNSKTGDIGPVTNVIKVRVAPRIDVPDSTTLNSINNFVNEVSGEGKLVDFSVGQELVVEDNAAYIVGGQRQDLFQVYEEDNSTQGTSGLIYPFMGYQPEVPNTCLTTAGVTATRYLEPVPVVWGQDVNLTLSAGGSCAYPEDWFTHQWFFQLDYNRLPLNIYVDLAAADFDYDPESLLCAALGDFESFLEWFTVYLLSPTLSTPIDIVPEGTRETRLVYYFKTVLDALFPPSTVRPFDILNRMRSRPPGSLENAPGFEDTRLKYKSFGTNASFVERNFDLFFQDINTIYSYLNKLATTYYGKAFNVEIPGLCFYVDPETKEVTFSDQPATDGAWVDTYYQFNCGGNEINFGDPVFYPNCVSGGTTGIMGMQHPQQTEYFMDDQGKLPAIIKFDPYKSYGKVQDIYEDNMGLKDPPPKEIQEYGPPNYFQGANLGDNGWREQPFGFSSLGFIKFTPLYVAGEVEQAWNIFKKPYHKLDDDGNPSECFLKGPSCSINAVVKLPDRVSLAPSLGFRYTTFGEIRDDSGYLTSVEKYVPDFPFFGIPDELVNRLGNNFRLGTWFNEFTFKRDSKTTPIYNYDDNIETFKDIVGSYVGSILKSTAISAGNFPFALPCNAVIPVKSNTRTYGPFYNQGYTDENNPVLSNLIQGKIYTEKDDSAVPWEFGGTLYLYQGMQAKINNLIMKMQNAERGSVTVAGYPQHELGTSLYERPSYINNHNEPDTDRGIPRDLEQGSFNTLNDGIKYYYYIDTHPSGQPLTQITDMSISVGSQGIQTTYTLSAYTPFKNRFTKTNYQRIKDQGLYRFKQRREAAASSQSGPKGAGKFGFIGPPLPRGPEYGYITNINTSFVERSAPALFIGQYLPDNGPAGPPPEGVIDPKNWFAGDASRKEVASQTLSQIDQLENYDNTALMSMDGLIRPIRNRSSINSENNGSGLGPNLPVTNDTGNFYANLDPFAISGYGATPNPVYRIPPANSGVFKPPSYTRVVDQQNSVEPMGPLNGGTSKNFFPRPEINAEFLNFLANPGSDLVKRGRGEDPLSGTFGHDIEVVARSSGDKIIADNAGYLNLLSTGLQVGYTDDYRFMAMRGPLMVHGWGYDLQGKPVPNSNETGVFSGQWDISINQEGFAAADLSGWPREYWTSGSPFSGQHRKDYHLLTDNFYSGWLNQPETWPAGPIDLRWDRQRSVWTVPNSYEFAFVDLETGVGGFSSGDGFIRNYTDMYDAAGNPIFTDVTIVNPFEDEIPAQSIIAFYSKRFATWFPIQFCCGTTDPTPPPPPPPPPTDCFLCNGQGACYWECRNGRWFQLGECQSSASCKCLPPAKCNTCPGAFKDKVAAGICIKDSCDDVPPEDCDGGGGGGGNGGDSPMSFTAPIVNFTVGNTAPFSGIGLAATQVNTYSKKPLRGVLQSDLTSYGSQSTGWGMVELYDGYETVFSGPYAAASGSGLVTSCMSMGYTDSSNCPPSGDRDNYKYALVMNNAISAHLPSGTDVNIEFDPQYGLFAITDYNRKMSEEVTADADILFYDYTKADASSNNIVLTLPDATGAFIPGTKYYVKKVDSTSNTVIVTGSSSQLIDGQTSYIMNNQYEAAEFVACGTGWMIF